MGKGSSSTNSNSVTNTNSAQNQAANSASQMAFGTNSGNSYGQNSGQASTQTYDPSALGKSYLQAGTTPAYNNISNYYNPYQQQVTDATMAQLGQQFGQQNSAVLGNAISNNALGGDRQAIAQAALAGQQGMVAGSTLAGLNAQNYNQALTASNADAARNLQAAGMSGGTTSGQSLASILGQSLGQTLGGVNAAQSTAGASAGTSSSATAGNSTTQGWSMDPMSMLPLMGLARGGSVHRAEGGGIDPVAQAGSDNGLGALNAAMAMLKGQSTPQAPALPQVSPSKPPESGKPPSAGGGGQKKKNGQDQESQDQKELDGELNEANSALGDNNTASSGNADIDLGADFGEGFSQGGLASLRQHRDAGGATIQPAPITQPAPYSGAMGKGSHPAPINLPGVSAATQNPGPGENGIPAEGITTVGSPESLLQRTPSHPSGGFGIGSGGLEIGFGGGSSSGGGKGSHGPGGGNPPMQLSHASGGRIHRASGGSSGSTPSPTSGGISAPNVSMPSLSASGISAPIVRVPQFATWVPDSSSGKGSSGVSGLLGGLGGSSSSGTSGHWVGNPATDVYAPLPSVPQPSVPQATATAPSSGGKGSGGAVDIGRTLAQAQSRYSGGRLHRDDGGDADFGDSDADFGGDSPDFGGPSQDIVSPGVKADRDEGLKGLSQAFQGAFQGDNLETIQPQPLLGQQVADWFDPEKNNGQTAADRLNMWLDKQTGVRGLPSPADAQAASAPGAGIFGASQYNTENPQVDPQQAPQAPNGGLAPLAEGTPAAYVNPTDIGDAKSFAQLGKPQLDQGAQPQDVAGTQNTPPSERADVRQVANPFAPDAAPLPGRRGVAQTMARSLRAAGASDNAIRGIMANVKDESNFDPTLRHPDQPKWGGEAHYAHGLFQEGGAEWNHYSQWLQQNHPGSDWRDPKLQTDFLAENLQQNYPGVWKAMNEGTPQQAAQAFVSGYLKPARNYEMARREAYGRGVGTMDDYLNGASPKGIDMPRGEIGQGSGIRNYSGNPVIDSGQNVGRGIQGVTQGVARGAEGVLGGIAQGLGAPPGRFDRMLSGPLGTVLQAVLPGILGGGFQVGNGRGVDSIPIGGQDQPGGLQGLSQQGQGGAGQLSPVDQPQGPRGQPYQDLTRDFARLDPKSQKAMVNAMKMEAIHLKLEQNKQAAGLPSALDGMSRPGAAGIDPNLSGQDAMTTLKGADPVQARRVQTILDGKAAVPTGRGRTQQDKDDWDMASRISNGQVTTATYPAMAAVQKKFDSGTWADARVAANKMVNHSANMYDHIDALHNYSSEWANDVTGPIAKQYSKPYQDALATFNTDKRGVAAETAKVFKGTGASADREVADWEKHYGENQSPTTLKGGIKETIDLMRGQLDPLAHQYNEATHKAPGDPGYLKSGYDLLGAQEKQKYDRIMGTVNGEKSDVPLTSRSSSQAPAAPTATGANGEKYILQNGKWVQQ